MLDGQQNFSIYNLFLFSLKEIISFDNIIQGKQLKIHALNNFWRNYQIFKVFYEYDSQHSEIT